MAPLVLFLAAVLVHTTLSKAVSLTQVEHLRRQSSPALSIPSSIPTQCESVCGPPNSTLSVTCNPPMASCLCTQTLQRGLFNCFSCIGQGIQATDYSTPQTDIDGITSACDGIGMPLPKLTFPGQNSNRPLATSATVKLTSAASQKTTAKGTSTRVSTASGTLTHFSASSTGLTSLSAVPSSQPSAIAPQSVASTSFNTASNTSLAGSAAATTGASPPSPTSGSVGARDGLNVMWMTLVSVLFAATFF